MTAELIFATLLILVIAGSILTVINDRMDTVQITEEMGKARMQAENVAEAVNKVYAGGEGHSVTISLPQNISDQDYTISIGSDGVKIQIDGMTGKAYAAPKKVLVDTSDNLMHSNQNYTITNVKESDGYHWIVITET